MAGVEAGIVEPVEEVGYKNRPPLLEDVSVEGPTRTPIPHALDTFEQRELIEDDYNWWRYSKFALPWLVFLLLLFSTLFTLTAFEQVGQLHNLRDGIPTYFQLQTDSNSKDEGRMPKTVRNLRCAATSISITGIVLAFLVLFAKPRPTPRKLLHLLSAFLIFAGMSLAWIAFGIGENKVRVAQRCPELYLLTNERCDKREGPATAANTLDFLLAISDLTAFVALVYTTLTGDFKLPRIGWRQQERDAETEAPAKNKHNVKPHRVRQTRLAFTALTLILALLLAIALTVFIVILHQDHNTINLRNSRGRTNRGAFATGVSPAVWNSQPWEEAGWPAKNTRLRYAMSGIGILTVLANLLPWRSRVIAYVFAFIYFCVHVLAIVTFAVDVDSLRNAKNVNTCRTTGGTWFSGVSSDSLYGTALYPATTGGALADLRINCINSPYVATAIFDFITAIALLIYIINEFVLRYKSVHSGRKYPWFYIRKVEQELDSRRPVRCELTSEVMTASEYYYRHRFLSPGELAAASSASESSEFPSVHYDPALYRQ